MTRFAADWATAGLPLLMHQFGVSVTYEHPDSEAVSLTAIVGPIRPVLQEDQGPGGIDRKLERLVTVCRDTDGDYGGIADPGVPGVFVIGGLDWAISEEPGVDDLAPEVDDNYARLRVVRFEAVQRSRQGWRSGI